MDTIPYRQIHMDFHTSPLIPGVGASFDADEFARVLMDSRVNSINLFAKCHHGMYYYPTRIGTVHPELGFDLLGAQMEACRKAGIRACIYTCVAWNEDWADRHPEWLQLNAEGTLGLKKPFAPGYAGWRFLCLNNTEHRAYLRAEFEETLAYSPAAYWIDIILQRGCICGCCLRDMRQRGMDPASPGDVKRHDRMVEIDFMREFWDFLKGKDPSVGVYFNGYPYELDLCDVPELSSAAKRRYFSFIDIESLPSEHWGYTHFPIAASFLGWRDQEITGMNGKFHKSWGDFGSLRNLEALEYECFRAVAHGARCCIGDQLHPSGKIDATVYNRIGQVFRSIEEKEPWLSDTTRVSQIGVFVTGRVLEEGGDAMSASVEGAYRMLSETHHCFDFLDATADLSRYELLVLPDSVRLTGEAAAKLSAYLAAGGKAIVTARSGTDESGTRFAFREIPVELEGEAAFSPRYVRITSEHFPGIPPMDYVFYEPGVAVQAGAGAQSLAEIVNPYFNRSWDRFSSHRQTAPAGASGEPAVVRRGSVAYVSCPIFRDYAVNGNKVYREIVMRLVGMLLPQPLLTGDLPTTAELTLRRRGGDLVLHALHYIVQRKCRSMDIVEERIPLFDRRVRVRCARKPARALLVPERREIPLEWKPPYAEMVLPSIEGHRMVLLEGAGGVGKV